MQSMIILISGRGSNMQALLAAKLPVEKTVVISNNPNAEGLSIARAHGLPTHVVNHRDYADRASFDIALSETIDQYQPDLIVLAGFMRILSAPFVDQYQGKLINIHPSLLPAFPGLDTHVRALQEGVKIHGCTVHFVTPKVDHGPIIIQAAVPVLTDDTPETLAAKILVQEHQIYPQAIRWFLQGRLALIDGQAQIKLNDSQHNTVLFSPEIE